MSQEEEGAVKVFPLEQINELDPELWPSGDLFLRGLQSLNVSLENPHENKPEYWQASARWALLKKYGYLSETESETTWCRRPDFIRQVTSLWSSSVLTQLKRNGYTDAHLQQGKENDLIDFLTHQGNSQGRKMQFDVMACAPGCQFNLHAHPNLELVYCARGQLHEVRMDGPPVSNKYDPHPTEANRVKGPNLSSMRRPWKFATLCEGTWLVNEAGSVHKSFTATCGSGCLLVTLWGGSHANILSGEEPTDPNVQNAVEQMDKKIGCSNCLSSWESLDQTFLPASERRK